MPARPSGIATQRGRICQNLEAVVCTVHFQSWSVWRHAMTRAPSLRTARAPYPNHHLEV